MDFKFLTFFSFFLVAVNCEWIWPFNYLTSAPENQKSTTPIPPLSQNSLRVNHSIAGSKYNRGQRYDSPQEQSETRIGNINPDSLGRDSFKDNQESSKHLKEFNGENASNWQQSFASASSGSSSFHSAVFTDEIANNPVYQSTTYQSQNVETTTKYQQTTYKNQPQYNNHNSESGQNETQNNSDSVQHPRPDVDYNQQTTLTGFSEDPEKNTQNQTTDYHETSTEKFIPFFFPNEEHHIVKINDTRLPDYLNLDIKLTTREPLKIVKVDPNETTVNPIRGGKH